MNSEATSPSDWLDHTHITSLIESSGDTAFLEALMANFSSMFEDHLERLEKAIDEGSAEGSRAALHSLKGACSTLGMHRLSLLIGQHETQVRITREVPRAAILASIRECELGTRSALVESKYIGPDFNW